MPPHPVQTIEEQPCLRNGLPVQSPSGDDGLDAARDGARRDLQLHPLLPLLSRSPVVGLQQVRLRGIESGFQFNVGVACHPISLVSTDFTVIPHCARYC